MEVVFKVLPATSASKPCLTEFFILPKGSKFLKRCVWTYFDSVLSVPIRILKNMNDCKINRKTNI